MESAFSVFVSGMVGVFAGMGALYVTMKVNALVAGAVGRKPVEADKAEKTEKSD